MRTCLLVLALVAGCDKQFNYDYCKTHPGSYPDKCGQDAGIPVDADIDAPPGTYKVFVAITGLTGTIVLQNNGGDDLTRSADGVAQFSMTLLDGAPYNVTIKTPPATGSCNISNAMGTIMAADVTTISVTCTLMGIHCSAAVCTPSTQVCCDNGGGVYACGAIGSCNTSFACDDDKDCTVSGDICCANVNGGSHVTSTQCEPETTCTQNGRNVVLCDPGAANPCPQDFGGGCNPSTLPEIQPLGYSQCTM
jgi:hypothetical protein